MRQRTFRGLAAIAFVGMLAGCGGSDSSPTGPSASGSLSATEAQVVAANLFTEIAKALSTATISSNVAADQSLALTPTTIHEIVNGTCTAGGTIKGDYTFTTDFGTTGSGSETGNMTVTSSGCKVSTGTRTIAVDGSYTLNFSTNFTAGAQSSNFQYTMTGNFTWDGGSCSINYSITLTPQGKESLTGSFCGQTISYSN